MKLVSKSEILMPGDCGVCHATENREWFLDTGVYLDFIGTFYVCNYCMADFIHAVQGLTKEEVFDAAQIHMEELHFKDLEIEEVARLTNNIAALLPLTFKQILEHFDEGFRADRVPSEPEPDVDVKYDPPVGSDEPTDGDDVELKLVPNERPTFSWD